MLKKIKILFIAMIVSTFSYSASATLISTATNGYTLDDSGIITSSDMTLEWLSWSATDGLSMTSVVLDSYYADGWYVASDDQMTSLMSDWFDVDIYGTTGSFNIESILYTTTGIDQDSIMEFFSFFGETGDFVSGTGAYFIKDSAALSTIFLFDQSINTDDTFFSAYVNVWSTNLAVALVRDVDTTTTDIPEPSSLALFGMGLLGLAGFRRRKQK